MQKLQEEVFVFKLFFAVISSALAPFLYRLVSFFGMAFLGFVGFDSVIRPALTKLQQYALNQLNAIPPDLRQFVYLTGINDAISIGFGAFFVALAIRGAKALSTSKLSNQRKPWGTF